MAGKISRWMKFPSNINWKELNKRLTKQRRKRNFVRKLKHGDDNFTDDPGPM